MKKALARISVLVVVGLVMTTLGLLGPRLPAVVELGASAYHFVLRHEKMPVFEGGMPVGFFTNPCGDGHDAMVAITRDDDDVAKVAYFLSDVPDRPWAVLLREPGQATADVVIYLDYNRDGYVDEKTTTDLDTCTAQARVRKISVKRSVPVING